MRLPGAGCRRRSSARASCSGRKRQKRFHNLILSPCRFISLPDLISLNDILSFPMSIMDVNEIRQILPHRYPFLLVDRIVEMDSERIVGIKNVTVNELFFNGHFPDFPVMPGVLIVEAIAQTAGVLVLKNIPDRDKKLVLLVSVDAAEFRKPVVPGDQLRIEMRCCASKARWRRWRARPRLMAHSSPKPK